MRILLIEDNPGDVRLLEEYLSEANLPLLALIRSATIADASRYLRNDHIDLVMLDLGLPDSQGVETVRKVRRLAPLTPIVVLTGDTDENLGVEAVREGAQDYLVKNWATARVVSRAVRYALERSQTEARIRESEDKYRTLFETMAQGVVYFDASGRITSCNSAAEQILGVDAKDMRGRTNAEMNWQPIRIDGSPYPAEEHPVIVSLRTGRSASGVMGVLNPRLCSYRWIDVHAAPRFRYGEQEPFEVFASFADITELRRLEKQGEIATLLQQALLDIPRELPGLTFGHLYRSATEAASVGGDFYDVFAGKKGRIGLLVGDVSGHGVHAARVATMVKDIVHAFAHQFAHPRTVLREANRLLVEKQFSGFVTAFLALLEPETGELIYCSAGHPPPLLATPDGICRLESIHPPLGVFPDAGYHDHEYAPESGSLLLLYTDGITDVRRDGRLWGEDGLTGALRTHLDEDIDRVPELLLEDALRFSRGRLEDDVALLAVRLTGPAIG